MRPAHNKHRVRSTSLHNNYLLLPVAAAVDSIVAAPAPAAVAGILAAVVDNTHLVVGSLAADIEDSSVEDSRRPVGKT